METVTTPFEDAMRWLEDAASGPEDKAGMALLQALRELQAYGDGYLLTIGEVAALVEWYRLHD